MTTYLYLLKKVIFSSKIFRSGEPQRPSPPQEKSRIGVTSSLLSFPCTKTGKGCFKPTILTIHKLSDSLKAYPIRWGALSRQEARWLQFDTAAAEAAAKSSKQHGDLLSRFECELY